MVYRVKVRRLAVQNNNIRTVAFLNSCLLYTLDVYKRQLYRWHIADPVFFQKDFKATIQALGWRYSGKKRRFLPLQDDIASTAFWYQAEPHAKFPELPDANYRENI